MPASAGSASSRRGSRPVAISTFSAVTLPPIQEISVPPGTSRAEMRRAPVTTRTPSCCNTRSSVSRASGSSPRSGESLRSTSVVSTPEAVQGLRELHGDRAGAADGQRFREVVQVQEVVAREEGGALHTGHRRDPRARAHGEHRGDAAQHGLAAALVVADDQRAVAEARVPAHPQDVVALQQFLVEAAPVVDHLVQAGHHGRAVDLHRRAHAELLATVCPVRDLRSPDQGLRRDAPDVDSGAAERLGLDHGDARAQPASAHRAGDPAHPPADHDELGRVRLELRHVEVRRARGQRARSSRRRARGGRARRRAAGCPRSRRGTGPTRISGGE